MTRLRWGILATGGIAQAFAADLKLTGFDVRAVASRSHERAVEFAARFSIPIAHASYAALAADPDVDIVYIATPHPQHVAPALDMIAAGKHVLIEKAFTANAAEARAIRDAAAERGVLAMEAMWTRYLPHMVRIRQLAESGRIGELRGLTADHTQSLSTDPAHRINALELGGGALLDLGIYPISFAWDLFGAPASVQATGRLGETGADTEVATMFTYPSGAVATTFSSSRMRGRNEATVIGSDAAIFLDSVWYKPTRFRVVDQDGTVLEQFESTVEGRGMHYQAAAAERLVAEGNLTGDVLPIDETVAIMECLDAIREQIGLRYPSDASA